MKSLYLIKRGPKPEWHRAPFHPVILCDLKRVADWEAGSTSDKATVWVRRGQEKNGQGWLMTRWKGFDIDYGHVVHVIDLPDGCKAGFWRDYPSEWSILRELEQATWWSDKPMPEWLAEKGVKYPTDQHSQLSILDTIADDCLTGFAEAREWPEWWPKGAK